MDSARSTPWSLVVIKVVILLMVIGITAAVVVPRFALGGQEAKRHALVETLDQMRKQLDLYRIQHQGRLPDIDTFAEQMMQVTEPGGGLGPYLKEVPINPYSNGRSIGSGPAGSSDWFYDELTGDFTANDRSEHRTW